MLLHLQRRVVPSDDTSAAVAVLLAHDLVEDLLAVQKNEGLLPARYFAKWCR